MGRIYFDNSRRAVIPDSLQSNNDQGSAVLSKEAIRKGRLSNRVTKIDEKKSEYGEREGKKSKDQERE